MAAAGRGRWLPFTLAIVAADRATKYAIERFTPQGFRREMIPHFADLVHSQNPGIAFGFFSESAPRWFVFLLMVSSAAVVLLLAWLLVTGRAGGAPSQMGFALIAGGAAGNLLDRLLHGGVTDFLELHAGRFVWPAFNLADSAITVGALLVVWELLRDGRHSSREHV